MQKHFGLLGVYMEIIGVRFRKGAKIYYFSPDGQNIPTGTNVIVETSRGVECGETVISNRKADENFNVPVKSIIRVATPEDMKIVEANKEKSKHAFEVCREKIKFRKLNMNLIDVECTFDNNKILFYFTSETRVDFRELVKDLASVFRLVCVMRQKCLAV
jgi:cell fate regulator YaaT (PSP1 superfamily)